MKKRISALCAALALILSLAACGGSGDTPAPSHGGEGNAPSAGVPAETAKTDDNLPEKGTDAYWLARAAALDEANALQSGQIGSLYSWYYDGEVLAVRGKGTLYDVEVKSMYDTPDNVANVLSKLPEGPVTVVVEPGCIAMGGAFGGDLNTGRAIDVIIADGVVALKHSTFYFCSELTKLTLPQSIIIVGEKVFRYCSNLTEITMPDNLIYMAGDAFNDCRSLSQIHWRGETYGSSYDFLEAVKAAGIPTKGDAPYFDPMTGVLNDVHVRREDNTVYVSGQGMVRGNDLYNILHKYSITTVVMEPGITGLEAGLFYNSKDLTSITLPDGLLSIEGSAFEKNENLTSITLPDSLEFIGSSAFSWSGLTSIVIPDSVTTMENSAFSSCHDLTEVTIGSGLTQFDASWFDGCWNLTKVKAPSGMREDVLKSGMDVSIFEWY